MTRIKTVSIVLSAAFAALIVVPAQAVQGVESHGNGRNRPPHCDDRYASFRHTDRDGHDHTMGREHAGHGHGEKTKNFKGYKMKPRCVSSVDAPAVGLIDRSAS